MTDKIVVFSACDSEEQAGQIARALVEQRLAACVNIVPGARSVYRWKGKIEDSPEWLLIIKSRRDLMDKLRLMIGSLHTYEVPELLAVPVVDGSDSYLAWLDRELDREPASRKLMARLVIAGGGFAGFWAAAAAARLRCDTSSLQPLEIVLISRDDRLVIRPRLYEANPADMSVALRPRLAAIGVRFELGEIETIDVACAAIHTAGSAIAYDKLVLATGSQLARPGGELSGQGFDIDTIAGAEALDRHLQALADRPECEGHWTVVIVGGGFTGIELATALRQRLGGKIRVIIVDTASRIGASLGDGPSSAIRAALGAAKIDERTGVTITAADPAGVTLSSGERIACQTLVWTTGMRASPLAARISPRTDALGRIAVTPELQVAGIEHVFAAGDVAHAAADDGHVILQSCQHAQTTGRFAGYNAAADVAGLPLLTYRQPLYTTCLDLGASGAVLTKGWDRTVEASGEDAKAIKRRINTQLIYPPAERDAILAAAAPAVMDENIFHQRILQKHV